MEAWAGCPGVSAPCVMYISWWYYNVIYSWTGPLMLRLAQAYCSQEFLGWNTDVKFFPYSFRCSYVVMFVRLILSYCMIGILLSGVANWIGKKPYSNCHCLGTNPLHCWTIRVLSSSNNLLEDYIWLKVGYLHELTIWPSQSHSSSIRLYLATFSGSQMNGWGIELRRPPS